MFPELIAVRNAKPAVAPVPDSPVEGDSQAPACLNSTRRAPATPAPGVGAYGKDARYGMTRQLTMTLQPSGNGERRPVHGRQRVHDSATRATYGRTRGTRGARHI
jgi:hypothetical protein